MAETNRISLQTARRFVLGKQGLWPGRRWTGKAGTREAMLAGEYIQLDPLVLLARSHDLVLHSRVTGYESQFFHELTYAERSFFEWGGWLAVRPMDELPYWRVVMRRERDHPGMRHIVDAHGPAVELVRAALRERSTVTNHDFAAEGPTLQHYRGSKPTSLALYYLWRTGEAMTHHRERFQRVYAMAEAVAPKHLLSEAAEGEADLFLARKAIAFAGIGRIGRVGQPIRQLLGRTAARDEERAMARRLVETNVLSPIEVESWRGTYFVLRDDLERLASVARGEVPQEWTPDDANAPPQVSLLSPLDPVSARGRAKALFGFDYMWEIYLPASQVQFGRYTLPILWGDQLVGRVDMRLDRTAGAVVINGLWMEDDATTREPVFATAFGVEIRRLMGLLAANRIDLSAVKFGSLRQTLGKLANA
jgi:uncharacterized protein YcaQ